jgi:sugar O-acyltransferase (sialic acid O-acetyltransferase NeuD family)
MKYVYIFGNNPLAELLHFYLTSQGMNVTGFVLNEQYINSNKYNLPAGLFSLEQVIATHAPEELGVYVTVAYAKMNRIRESIFQQLQVKKISIMSFIHPSCIIADNAKIGCGNIFLENAVIQPFSTIGDGNIFWEGTLISHHCKVGNYNYFSPGVAMSGIVRVENRCFFGSNVTVRNNVEIGNEVMVGAGAYVWKSFNEGSVIVPPRSIELEKRSMEMVLV